MDTEYADFFEYSVFKKAKEAVLSQSSLISSVTIAEPKLKPELQSNTLYKNERVESHFEGLYLNCSSRVKYRHEDLFFSISRIDYFNCFKIFDYCASRFGYESAEASFSLPMNLKLKYMKRSKASISSIKR